MKYLTESTTCLDKPAQRALDLGLSREQINGHNWDDFDTDNGHTGLATIRYLEKFCENTPIHELMDLIRGLNGHQIDAMSLGLNHDQLSGHTWTDTGDNDFIAHKTYRYLDKMRRAGRSVPNAMDRIRGKNALEIRMITVGIPPHKMHNHNWENKTITDNTIYYLEKCPVFVKPLDAWNNIRGLNETDLLDICKATSTALTLDLPANLLYSCKFTSDMLQNSALYGYINLVDTERNFQMPQQIFTDEVKTKLKNTRKFIKKSVSGAFDSNLEAEIPNLYSFFTLEDASRLAMTRNCATKAKKPAQSDQSSSLTK